MKHTFKNVEMAAMLENLKPLLSRRDKIGYAAARNFRFLSQTLTEYFSIRNDLIRRYGTEMTGEGGTKSVGIHVNSPEFQKFCDELAPFNEMEHEVELMTVRFDEVVGILSGEEILRIDWMLED